jgi:hypothetical protein
MVRQAAKSADDLMLQKRSNNDKDSDKDIDKDTECEDEAHAKDEAQAQTVFSQTVDAVDATATVDPALDSRPSSHPSAYASGNAGWNAQAAVCYSSKRVRTPDTFTGVTPDSGASSASTPEAGEAVLPQFRSLDALLAWENDRRARLASGVAGRAGNTADPQYVADFWMLVSFTT